MASGDQLSSHIKSIPAVRMQRQQETDALIDMHQAHLRRLCFKTLERVQLGEITGLAIIEACPHGPDLVSTSGVFTDDLGYLASCIGAFADLVDDTRASLSDRR
jgi:hypothetical protein